MTLLNVFFEFFRLIVEGLCKEAQFPETVFNRVQYFFGRGEKSVVVITFRGGREQGGFAAADRVQKILDVKTGADVELDRKSVV